MFVLFVVVGLSVGGGPVAATIGLARVRFCSPSLSAGEHYVHSY